MSHGPSRQGGLGWTGLAGRAGMSLVWVVAGWAEPEASVSDM